MAISTRFPCGLGIIGIIFGIWQLLSTIEQSNITFDEPVFYKYSERFYDTGELERESNWLFNSKTPINVLNVVISRLSMKIFDLSPSKTWQVRRMSGLVWYLIFMISAFILARKFLTSGWSIYFVGLMAMDPVINSNSAVLTVDTAFAAGYLMSIIAVLAYIDKPDARNASFFGFTLGLLLLIKITAVVLIPLLFLGALVVFHHKMTKRHLYYLALTTFTALIVLNLGFGFHGFASELKSIPLHWDKLVDFQKSFPSLRLPVPDAFITMIDQCAVWERTKPRNVMLLGQYFPGGVWYYFPFTFFLKTPLLALFSILLGIILFASRISKDRQDIFIGFLLILIWGYFCFFFRNHKGYRYIMMSIPLYYLLALRGLSMLREPWRKILATIVIVGTIVESTPYTGNNLAFSNALVWDKRVSYKYLSDSNVDWNQNYRHISIMMKSRKIDSARLNPKRLLPGINIIQHNFLTGVTHRRRYEWLRENIEPVEHFRHTYLVFYLSKEDYGRYLNQGSLRRNIR
jgi:4-amino-4-deoxy-L-arabinose transferase-like glycosyltransferase